MIVPLINIYVISPSFSAALFKQAEKGSEHLVNHLSAMLLRNQSALAPQRVRAWGERENDDLLQNFNLLKLRIFSSTGEIIFSSQADEIGTINTKPYFHEIVAKGKIFSKIVVKESLSLEGSVFQQDVVETYVPIVRNGSFLGAMEVYQNITETLGAINRVLLLIEGLPIAVMLLFMIGFCVGVMKVDHFIQLQLETEKKLKEQRDAIEQEKKDQLVIFNKVEQAKKEWENTMDCVADMVMLTNTEYKIQRCNKAVLDFTGLSYREVFKKRVFDIFPEHENFQEECFERGCEYYHQPTDKWFLLTVYPLRNPEGEVIALVFNVHDLTEIKKVSIALQNSNIEIDDNRRQLQEALNSISELLSKVVNEKTFDVTFENPTLQRCYIVKKCGQEDCPCYGREPVRCWQEQGTFCIGGKAGSAVDKRECLHCNHYLATIADPIFQIGEQFNNMMYILAEKNKEVEHAYSDLKMAQSQLLQQEKMASIGQ
jgi:PAS domain S-box-containing protein